MNENGQQKNWEFPTLGEVCEVVRGGFPRPMGDPRYFTGSIPFLKIADITKMPGKFVFDSQTKVNELGAEKSRLLPKGTLVLTNSATVCVPKFLGVDACIHDGFVAFQNFTRQVDLNYLYHFFDYTRPYVVQKHKQGVTQVNLNIEIVNGFEVPLPNIDEQERIVAKIEELFSELDAGVESLKKAQAQLKTYRQAVLKSAFEGKLTNENVTEGELPNGWKSVKIDHFLNDARKDMRTGPFGTMLKKSEHLKSGVAVLGIENIGEGIFQMPNKIFITDKKAVELRSFGVKAGDIIISRSGTVGEICSVPDSMTGSIISTNLIKVSIDQKIVLPKFFVYLFQGGMVRQQVFDLCKGSSRAFLNQTILKSLDFPYCSPAEQQRIVEEIESRLSVCDKLEETIAASLKQSEALRQSILKRAFEGRLVTH
ncbi:MAG: restriction endonuclease subunit S [Pyrinomonadaceae bacterium]